METGIVFDIKEFAVFDGPGIRTTVFLKGCPLRCQWCHNPEGLKLAPELVVSRAACTHCGACEAICSHEECIACGACIPYCKGGFRKIVGAKWTAQALADRLNKDRRVLEAAGGGVTFSGGEPLMQWPFVRDVIGRLNGLHTAVETSGYCPDGVFGQVMETVDLILLDLKVMDARRHRRYTGADNGGILRHARMLREGNTPFIIRIPLIPGVNDDEENMRATARLIAGAKALERVELLPYHLAAGAKYEMVDMRYGPDFDVEARPRAYKEPFEEAGIDVAVI